MLREALTKWELYRFLNELKSSPGEYVTLYAKPTSFPDYINELALRPEYSRYANEIKELVNEKVIIREAEKYNTGAVVFWQAGGDKHIVLPPFPITANKIATGNLDASLLYETMDRKYAVGVVLIAWGSYAIGIFEGDGLVESKVGTGYIHKEHKKGGSSQKRFARRTEEQRRDFLRKVSNRIEERFRNHTLDYIFFGGNRLIYKPLLRECKYLELEAGKISDRILNVRYADKETLGYSLEQIKTSIVFSD
ncbi:MAG: Vms1/Ankzf1 family peptidyl-tRNA hydrolase [Chloroflexota bacterium]|nr:Vms1/Ankzf1 family peptidyl-tRNA hydrolase [Chloroflexota bacterium]